MKIVNNMQKYSMIDAWLGSEEATQNNYCDCYNAQLFLFPTVSSATI